MLSYFIGLLLKILVKTHGFVRNSGNTKALIICLEKVFFFYINLLWKVKQYFAMKKDALKFHS